MSCLPASGGAGKQLSTSSVAPLGTPQNAALDSLRDELGAEAATRFVVHYLALLDGRVTGVGELIEQGRIEPAITLLLSLETSSHMVGALDLSACAAELRLLLAQPWSDSSGHYQALVRAAESARQSLAPS
jgi:hypothetical protein